MEYADQDASPDWSFTQSSLYAACPRAFCISRNLNSLKSSSDEISPSRDALSLPSLVGIAVHRSIADQIEKWYSGQRMDLREAQSQVKAWLTHVWENASRLIIEAVNGQQLDHDLLPKLIHTAKSRVHTFFFAVWPQFTNHTYILHETLRMFMFHGHRIWVKVDLCTREPHGEIAITDWKTGQSAILSNNLLQMSVYAFWAANEFSESPTAINVQLANLKTGELVTHKMSSGQLNESIERVLEDCDKWTSKNMFDYVAKPDVHKCFSCRYLDMCAEGMEVTGLRG
jgi:hypothetical protein